MAFLDSEEKPPITLLMRPKKNRCIAFDPQVTIFKPTGIPLRQLEQVSLDLDEIEAIRLADHEGLYHEDAGARMGISRQTFGRLLNTAHQKVAAALIQGKALMINTHPKD